MKADTRKRDKFININSEKHMQVVFQIYDLFNSDFLEFSKDFDYYVFVIDYSCWMSVCLEEEH